MSSAGSERFWFSPSRLANFVACPHLTTLEVAALRWELDKPYRHNAHADVIRRKGDEHEAAYLASLGPDVISIGNPWETGWDGAARDTEQAMTDGAPVVYQATFVDGDWRGLADFVVRQPDRTYEALDTKLARHARPAHIIQLCFYTEQIARIQGSMPHAMHVVTGAGEKETFDPNDYLAFYRRLRGRFLDAVTNSTPTYPYPVEHCGLCDFLSLCKAQWERDDHLTLVAGISRTQVERLTAAGITTLEALGDLAPDTRVKSIRPETLDGLRLQAELQLHRRRTADHRVQHLPLEPDRGFNLMPEPCDEGDIWLDLEGHPWYEAARGLEYLFGWVYLDEGQPRYDCIWAEDRATEKAGFERLVDLLVERRRRFPGMHVYHYASYERSALTRLMGEYATREEEIDDLLRGEVLVDLYRVVHQALRASLPSYSIKAVEELYGFERTAEVSGGSESVVNFEEWLETGERKLLEEIRDYNEEDCRSLYELHRWLIAERPDVPWRAPPEEREVKEETKERLAEREALRDELLAKAEEGDPRWLLAQLLDYHRREEKPQWWAYFNNLTLDEEELIASSETIGGLELDGEPELDGKSFTYTFRFPPQEHKIGSSAVDPATEKTYDVKVDDERGLVTIRRSVKRAEEPLPKALIPTTPLHTRFQRDAVLRFAKDPERYFALVEILERRRPERYVFVQGPPGSGKTYTGARRAVERMKAGQRVGVTALSHKAINQFLKEVENVGYAFRGRKKSSGEDTEFEGEWIDSSPDNADLLDPELQLIAGTSFLFSRPEFEGHVHTLFVDEGGQMALADALAVGTAASELILLGDPNQLAQVSQGSHPPGADASVLGHLLGDDETVRPGMGEFLEHTWRMRPEVNAYISETFYESRLEPAEVCLKRSVALGNGLRFVEIAHEGHRVASVEEAEFVRDEIERLLGTSYVDEHGERELRHEDVVVVAPYNAQVRCLRTKIPDQRVRIGTVDKFQGQEAPVVFYSMASSSGDDVPRGLDFLFSQNRLNVAISRANCLAYLVASPRLLDANCRTVEQMRLANSLCRFVEQATPVSQQTFRNST
jgi:predicted RecB family nuclease